MYSTTFVNDELAFLSLLLKLTLLYKKNRNKSSLSGPKGPNTYKTLRVISEKHNRKQSMHHITIRTNIYSNYYSDLYKFI